MPSERWVLIANPVSGTGKRRHLVERVAHQLQQAGRAPELIWTARHQHAEELAGIAVQDGATHVIACGGDGTVHQVVNGVLKARHAGGAVTVGIVPLGRCNDLARALGIPLAPGAMAPTLLKGTVRTIDLGTVGDQYFNTVATLGFDSLVAEYVAAGRPPRFLTGTSAYVYATLVNLLRYHPFEMRLRGDFGTVEGPMLLAATGNTSSYGGRMKIVPTAAPDDGALDVCLVRHVSRWEVLRMLPTVFSGSHVKHPKVSLHRTRNLEIATQAPLSVWADGERVGSTPITFGIVPNALRILAPPA